MESSDEEDDTAERIAACGEAPPEPPAGFRYVQACPPLITLDHKKALVGRKVLSARIDDGACGWFVGTTRQRPSGQAGQEVCAHGDARH